MSDNLDWNMNKLLWISHYLVYIYSIYYYSFGSYLELEFILKCPLFMFILVEAFFIIIIIIIIFF